MPRYFLEVAYKGTNYSGFQVQENAITVQSEIEKALQVLFRKTVALTGSSRTDSGVHARQNFFHFDSDNLISSSSIYNLNAILSPDIVILGLHAVPNDAHCRFDALYRRYRYRIYSNKNPFINEIAYFFPYKINITAIQEASSCIVGTHNFRTFSKRNTQVKTFICNVISSEWKVNGEVLEYHVSANRFLRGMVRGLVGTMLHVGRGKMSLEKWKEIILSEDSSKADFSVPGKGLWLEEVSFPTDLSIPRPGSFIFF